RHRSVRLVILVGLAIDQIAQSGLSSLSVIYYSAQLFRISITVPFYLCFTALAVSGVLPSATQNVGNASWGDGLVGNT
ncbi:hypothetical protein ACS8A1_19545, partial [Yersinia enterocolitica]|uniref:hypothetical protein n=1 Tax=Yersinia enterocolitica TaxID=630 RepID=UPI003F470099